MIKNGKRHFIACTGWLLDWRKDHMSWSIPDSVKEEDLQLLFAGKPLAGFERPLHYSHIVPAHVGSHVKNCSRSFSSSSAQLSYLQTEWFVQSTCIQEMASKPYLNDTSVLHRRPFGCRLMNQFGKLLSSSIRTILIITLSCPLWRHWQWQEIPISSALRPQNLWAVQ
jgi:hypothetical protein